MLQTLSQVARPGPLKKRAIRPARAMMLGGMWDADVQSEWRDSCAGFCGTDDPHTQI